MLKPRRGGRRSCPVWGCVRLAGPTFLEDALLWLCKNGDLSFVAIALCLFVDEAANHHPCHVNYLAHFASPRFKITRRNEYTTMLTGTSYCSTLAELTFLWYCDLIQQFIYATL